jgi:hypothetical protein
VCSTALTLRTLPPVEVDPILTIKTSCFASFETFVCFLSSPVALTPSNLIVSKRTQKEGGIEPSQEEVIDFEFCVDRG